LADKLLPQTVSVPCKSLKVLTFLSNKKELFHISKLKADFPNNNFTKSVLMNLCYFFIEIKDNLTWLNSELKLRSNIQ